MIKAFIKQFKDFKKALRTSFYVSPFIFFFYIFSLIEGYINKTFLDSVFITRCIDNFFEWLLHNENYVIFIFVAIIIDHLIGTVKYLILRKFSIKENIIGLFTKIFITILGAILFEGMNIIADTQNIVKDYLVITTRLIVFLYPARSAFRNMSYITKGVFPPKSWIDKMDSFSINLDYKEFTKGNKKEKKDE